MQGLGGLRWTGTTGTEWQLSFTSSIIWKIFSVFVFFFFLMNTDQLFRRLSLNLVCQMFPRDKTSVIHFWHQLYKSDALFALQHMTSGCLTVCDAHVESLVKIVSAKILHHRVATFPFIMDKDLVETCKSNFHPLVLTSVIDSCLHQLLPWWLSMGELWH